MHSGYDGAPVELALTCGHGRIKDVREAEEWCQGDLGEDGYFWVEPDSGGSMEEMEPEMGCARMDRIDNITRSPRNCSHGAIKLGVFHP